MNALNLIAVITGIISSIAVTVSVVVGVVPRFRHKAVRATVRMIEGHKNEYYTEIYNKEWKPMIEKDLHDNLMEP